MRHAVNLDSINYYKKNRYGLADQSIESLEALFDCVLDSIVIINETGIIESVNPAVEKTFGYTQEEVIGQNVKMLKC